MARLAVWPSALPGVSPSNVLGRPETYYGTPFEALGEPLADGMLSVLDQVEGSAKCRLADDIGRDAAHEVPGIYGGASIVLATLLIQDIFERLDALFHQGFQASKIADAKTVGQEASTLSVQLFVEERE